MRCVELNTAGHSTSFPLTNCSSVARSVKVGVLGFLTGLLVLGASIDFGFTASVEVHMQATVIASLGIFALLGDPKGSSRTV